MLTDESIEQFKTERAKEKSTAGDYLFLDNVGVLFAPNKPVELFVSRVSELIDEFKLKIVLTSSERYDVKAFDEYLHNFELNEDIHIFDRTGLDDNERDQQIMNWILKHDVRHFLILDDELMDPVLKDYAVQTSFWSGFTEYAFREAQDNIRNQFRLSCQNI